MTAYELRPLTLGEVLDRAFSIYRAHFRTLVGIAAAALVVPYAIYGVAMIELARQGGPALANLGGVVVVGIGFVILMAAYLVVQVAVMHSVSELYLGHPVTIGEALGRTGSLLLPLLGLGILSFLGVFFGFLLLIVPGIILALRWGVAVPALVVERRGGVEALSRSQTLTKGMAGRVFVVYLLQIVVSAALSMLLSLPVIVYTIATGATQTLTTQALSQVAQVISNVLMFPLASAIVCVLYYDLRVRKEGFDLQQMMEQLGRPAGPGVTPPPVAG
jgi:hypothetical protein